MKYNYETVMFTKL